MRPVRSVALVVCASMGVVALTGCKPAAAPMAKPMVMPATAEQATQIQTNFTKIDPNARVGHVAAVDEGMKMVAVSGIPVADVHHEDTLTFLDSKQNAIANGTIKRADVSTPEYPMLIVEFSPTPGGRSPMKGDLAVYLSASAH